MLLFSDYVVFLSSSVRDLQHSLNCFAVESEAAGMRISTSKSEATLALEHLGVPQSELVNVVRDRDVWGPLLELLPP